MARPARPPTTPGQLDLTALAAAGLGAWSPGLPEVSTPGSAPAAAGISGGERARLSIARALLSQRPVLLLDEPVAHLDHPTALAVMHDLMAARGGRSVVVVSHRPEGLAEAHGIMDLTGPRAVPAAVPTLQ